MDQVTQKAIELLQAEIERLKKQNESLRVDQGYGILTRQGLDLAIQDCREELNGMWAIFLDIDNLHEHNKKHATYEPINTLIRNALSLRHDDLYIVGKWQSGDEILFIVKTNPAGFVARLNGSLAKQTLTATSAYYEIENNDVMAAVEKGIVEVKRIKALRPQSR